MIGARICHTPFSTNEAPKDNKSSHYWITRHLRFCNIPVHLVSVTSTHQVIPCILYDFDSDVSPMLHHRHVSLTLHQQVSYKMLIEMGFPHFVGCPLCSTIYFQKQSSRCHSKITNKAWEVWLVILSYLQHLVSYSPMYMKIPLGQPKKQKKGLVGPLGKVYDSCISHNTPK